MSDDRWTWDPALTLQALSGADVALWLWEPEHDRLRLTGATRALGLGPLAPSCSSAALRALALPRDRGLADDILTVQPPGVEVAARVRMRGAGVAIWRGVWLEDGRATGVVALETKYAASEHDPLTGLLDRKSFLTRARERLQAPGAHALIVADVDRLRRLNEALGHERADLVLAALASRLAAALPPEALAARIGEDEFAVLCPATAPLGADAVRRALEQPLRIAGFDIHPTVSVGALEAAGGPDAAEATELLRRAALAVEAARASGRGHAAAYGRSLESDSLSKLALEADLKEALERGELAPFYQPIVRLRTGALAGFEALVRWRHPRRGLLGPEQFLPLLDEMGLMGELGAMMRWEAARQLAAWRAERAGAGGLSMSVNLSVGELDGPNLLAQTAAVRREAELPEGALKLEVTEGEVMRDPDQAALTLQRLRGAGIGLAIDDFGAGFSSLSYLSRLPFDTLKIDAYFVRTLGRDPSSAKIVASIVKLGRDLSLEVVAEGVEDAEVAQQLAEFGCDFGQGYGFAPALTAEEAFAFIRDSATEPARRFG